MKIKEWKIGEKKSGKGVWLRGGGGEKGGGARLFSLWAHQNSMSPKWRENVEDVCWTKLPFSCKIFTHAIFCLWKFEFIYILSKVRLFILYSAYVFIL